MTAALRIAFALVALFVAFAAYVVYTGEWVEDEVDLGYTEAARRDPTLAARLFLERFGKRTRVLDENLVGMPLPPANATLLSFGSTLALSERDEARLVAWVRSGGHLIAVPSSPSEVMLYGRRDGLARELGWAAQFADIYEEEDTEAGVVGAPTDSCATHRVLRDSDGHTLMTVSPLRLRAVGGNAAGRVLARDEHGVAIVQVPLGSGRVTLTVDSLQWTNPLVGCHDHAHVLLGLVGDSPELWSALREAPATIWELLWMRGKPVLAVLALLIALALWRAAPRFGPLLPSPPVARRERREALRAAAEFLWRRRDTHGLLAGLRARVRSGARRRFGHDDAVDALAARAAVAPAAALTAMTVDPHHERDFVATTNTLLELIDHS